MSHHALSDADRQLQSAFEAATLPLAHFDHRAHLRLAYAYLAEADVDRAVHRIREGLIRYLAAQGVDAGKYHETLTQAWVLAVRHFMRRTGAAADAEAFLDANPSLLDTRIMLSHYSAERLQSADARRAFLAPDLDPIPVYG